MTTPTGQLSRLAAQQDAAASVGSGTDADSNDGSTVSDYRTMSGAAAPHVAPSFRMGLLRGSPSRASSVRSMISAASVASSTGASTVASALMMPGMPLLAASLASMGNVASSGVGSLPLDDDEALLDGLREELDKTDTVRTRGVCCSGCARVCSSRVSRCVPYWWGQGTTLLMRLERRFDHFVSHADVAAEANAHVLTTLAMPTAAPQREAAEEA